MYDRLQWKRAFQKKIKNTIGNFEKNMKGKPYNWGEEISPSQFKPTWHPIISAQGHGARPGLLPPNAHHHPRRASASSGRTLSPEAPSAPPGAPLSPGDNAAAWGVRGGRIKQGVDGMKEIQPQDIAPRPQTHSQGPDTLGDTGFKPSRFHYFFFWMSRRNLQHNWLVVL